MLTHFNNQGRARMVDVTEKAPTHRRAVAAGEILVSPGTMAQIRAGTLKKGTRRPAREMCWGWRRWPAFKLPSTAGS